jgi:TPR repeat protein
MKKSLFVAIVMCALGTATAHAADSAVFERMPADKYADLLREGGLAYDHKDYARAFELNKRTACAGDKTSQAILARMYLLGQGIARDDYAGYAWIKLAAEIKFGDFTSLSRKIEGALKPAQLAQAQAAAAELRKNYGLAATGMSCRAESRHGAYIIDSVVCTPQSDGGGMVLLRRCVDDAAK